MRAPLRLAISLTLASTIGCSAYMHAMTPKPRVVENPLASGQPLKVTKKGDVGVVSESDCNIWPFEDKLDVEVTEAQICIVSHKHTQAPPGWTGEPTMNRSEGFKVANDANEGGYINAEKTHAAKVGSCFDKGYNQQTSIWAFDYKGCAPNNGTVSKSTKSLQVGDESWDFAGAAAATAEAPARANPS